MRGAESKLRDEVEQLLGSGRLPKEPCCHFRRFVSGMGSVKKERAAASTFKSRAPQTSPLSARHIAGGTLAEKSGIECARGPYLWDFTLFTSPISLHPKSSYASQGLWRGLEHPIDHHVVGAQKGVDRAPR